MANVILLSYLQLFFLSCWQLLDKHHPIDENHVSCEHLDVELEIDNE